MKSRSPAPGKKSVMGGKKSELQDLPPMDSMPDGDRNYFVGGWSTEGSFASAVTNIASQTKVADKDTAAEEPMLKVAKDLERGRFVAAIQQPDSITDFTKTNVIILPGLAGADANNGAAAPRAVAEVTHGMFISGLLPNSIATATADFNKRHPTEAAEGNADGAADMDEVAADVDAPEAPKPRYEVTYRDPGAEEEEDEEGPVDEDGNPIVPATPEAVAKEVERLRAKGSSVAPNEITDFLNSYTGAVKLTVAAQSDPQRLTETRHQNAPTAAGGNGFAKPKRPTLYRKGISVVNQADLVVVRGPVAFSGIRPMVAVEAEAVTATRVATSLGLATLTTVDKSGKPKRKTEEEKQKEAEATARLEEESAEAARAEEVRLNAFAMPDRWPTAYVSNLAFDSPVTIQNAHLRFYRCHFSGANADPKAILVSVSQYCRVEFVECTFQQVAHTAIYGYPTSELYIEECYFSRQTLPTTIDEALAQAIQPLQAGDLPASGESSTAIHVDAVKLTIIRSHFEGFGNAVIYRNKLEVLGRMGDGEDEEGGAEGEKFGVGAEANDEGHLPIRLRPALSNITECVFINNAASSINLINARRISITKNYINDEASAGYYSVQVSGDTSTPQVIRCQISGRILIGKGSKPFLHKNTGKVQIIDKNAAEAPYMSPTY